MQAAEEAIIETYTFLRELADSWVLLAMTLFFISMILWTLRPSTKETLEDISRIPLRNEDAPLVGCSGGCPDCAACTTRKFEVGS